MTATSTDLILKARLLVGYLGEQAQYAWWPTKFYEASSRGFLDPVFTKTSRLAQYRAVLEAARRVHDEHLNVGSYHLFRLPEETEQDLHFAVQATELTDYMVANMSDRDSAVSALRHMSDNSTTTRQGPMLLGTVGSLRSGRTIGQLVDAYLSAFSGNYRTYPYFDASK
jgi:hypothetical protein